MRPDFRERNEERSEFDEACDRLAAVVGRRDLKDTGALVTVAIKTILERLDATPVSTSTSTVVRRPRTKKLPKPEEPES